MNKQQTAPQWRLKEIINEIEQARGKKFKRNILNIRTLATIANVSNNTISIMLNNTRPVVLRQQEYDLFNYIAFHAHRPLTLSDFIKADLPTPGIPTHT